VTRHKTDALVYFATPGPLTDLSAHVALVERLPTDVGALCGILQGLVMHPFLTHLYDVAPDAVRRDEVETRPAAAIVDRIRLLDPQPLDVARPPIRRFIGNCRHFTVLLCALLRARGLPARARCGFAAYFEPTKFVDHWVCEVWDSAARAWVLVDAQLDGVQRQAFRIPFDPLDVPRDQFLVAGDAWQQCRAGRADPQRFGILDMFGLWFIRGNVVRDVAARAKRELLPWDGWGLMTKYDADSDAAELAMLDHAAELTLAGDERLDELLTLQAAESGMRVPREIVSYNLGGASVDLGPGIAN
jgi:hypothetical protein